MLNSQEMPQVVVFRDTLELTQANHKESDKIVDDSQISGHHRSENHTEAGQKVSFENVIDFQKNRLAESIPLLSKAT